MSFRGSIADFPLTDVLQLMAVSNRTGVLHLRDGEKAGEIHVDKGQIVHAAAADLSGEQAFFELARWLSGEFELVQGVVLAPRTITTSNTNLILEAARQIDEWKLLAKKIGSTRMVLAFAPTTASAVSLSALEWSIVSRVDGRRNIEEIAAALGKSAFEVCKVVHGLLTAGVVVLRDDLRNLHVDRVKDLSSEELDRLAGEIHRSAEALLSGHADRTTALAGALRLYHAEHGSGRTVDALLDLIREDEKIVSGALGPNQARAFLDRVTTRLSAGVGGAPARPVPVPVPAPAPPAPPSPPPLPAPRPPVDLKKVRSTISELAYRGLGPEGEAHVLKIERAKTAEELRKVGTACSELLRRIGRTEVADAFDAELAGLR